MIRARPAILRLNLLRDDAFPGRAEALGFGFHSPDGREYWARDACYALTPEAVAAMEAAARELNGMIAAAVDRVVARGDYAAFGFTDRLAALVEASHRAADPSLYGRFDFFYDGGGPPKLYEYNADTPTSIYEAAVFQWLWLEDRIADGTFAADTDQFNSLYEKLVARFRGIFPTGGFVHFASCPPSAPMAQI